MRNDLDMSPEFPQSPCSVASDNKLLFVHVLSLLSLLSVTPSCDECCDIIVG